MKAVVVELRGRKAAVLDHDGIVRILPDRNYRIGQVLEVSSVLSTGRSSKIVQIGSFLRHHYAAAAAAAVILLGSGAFITASRYPVSTLSLDLNGRLEYRMNLFDKVLSVRAQAEEGEKAAREIEEKVKGVTIDNAIDTTLDYYMEEQVLTEENSSISVNVESFSGHSGKLEASVEARVAEWNSSHSSEKLPEGVRIFWGNDPEPLPGPAESSYPDSGETVQMDSRTAAEGKPSGSSPDTWSMPAEGTEIQNDPSGNAGHPSNEDRPKEIQEPQPGSLPQEAQGGQTSGESIPGGQNNTISSDIVMDAQDGQPDGENSQGMQTGAPAVDNNQSLQEGPPEGGNGQSPQAGPPQGGSGQGLQGGFH